MKRISNLLRGLEIRKLLWTNPNATANFASTTILDSSVHNYDYIEVEFASIAPRLKLTTTVSADFMAMIPTWRDIPSYRACGVKSNGIYFSDAFAKSQTVDNSQIVPYRVYGIKKIGGGYCITSILCAISSLVRRWSHVDYFTEKNRIVGFRADNIQRVFCSWPVNRCWRIGKSEHSDIHTGWVQNTVRALLKNKWGDCTKLSRPRHITTSDVRNCLDKEHNFCIDETFVRCGWSDIDEDVVTALERGCAA